MTFYDDQSLAK